MQVIVRDDFDHARKRPADFLCRFERENALEIDMETCESADALLKNEPSRSIKGLKVPVITGFSGAF